MDDKKKEFFTAVDETVKRVDCAQNQISPPNQCCKHGLQAIRNSNRYVEVKHPRNLLGSANIDECLAHCLPNCPRWDYVIGYYTNGQIESFFIEIHEANMAEIDKVHKKFIWLKTKFLKNSPLSNYHSRYYWIASGKVRFPEGPSRLKKLRQLAQEGLTFGGRKIIIPSSS